MGEGRLPFIRHRVCNRWKCKQPAAFNRRDEISYELRLNTEASLIKRNKELFQVETGPAQSPRPLHEDGNRRTSGVTIWYGFDDKEILRQINRHHHVCPMVIM